MNLAGGPSLYISPLRYNMYINFFSFHQSLYYLSVFCAFARFTGSYANKWACSSLKDEDRPRHRCPFLANYRAQILPHLCCFSLDVCFCEIRQKEATSSLRFVCWKSQYNSWRLITRLLLDPPTERSLKVWFHISGIRVRVEDWCQVGNKHITLIKPQPAFF